MTKMKVYLTFSGIGEKVNSNGWELKMASSCLDILNLGCL